MDRWAAGDADGLEALYALHGPTCYGLALAVLRDALDAEDAVQEAFVDLWRSRACFDARRSSVRSWLLMLTHRRAVDRVRSEQRRRTSELGPEHDFPDDRSGPDAQVITAQLAEQAQAALATLPPTQREALVLAYWGGYTQREIASLTGTPIGTVKSRMHAGMRELRTQAPLVQSAEGG